MVVGMAGACLLGVGLFMPVLGLGGLGGVSLVNIGVRFGPKNEPENLAAFAGVAVLAALAFFALMTSLVKLRALVGLCGWLAGAVLGLLAWAIGAALTQAAKESGAAATTMVAVQAQWGCAVLLLGVVLLVITPLLPRR